MSRDPSKAFGGTWMASPEKVGDLDRIVRQRLERHMASLGPQSVGLLADDLRKCNDHRLWFLGTCVCALLAELLFGAEEGGIFRKSSALRDLDLREQGDCLRELRNACFHPAHVNEKAGSGLPHVAVLAERIASRAPRVADDLRRDCRVLRSAEVYVVALRVLDEAGRTFIRLAA